jgi:cytochrome c553
MAFVRTIDVVLLLGSLAGAGAGAVAAMPAVPVAQAQAQAQAPPRPQPMQAASAAQPTGLEPKPHRVPDTLAQRLLACTGCHGAEGRASNEGYLPRIAGKPAGYLYNQLINFREGRRPNAAMVRLVAPLSPAYLRQIAQHFAAQEVPYPSPQTRSAPADVLAAGERLAREGDSTRQLPACAACHGKSLMGMQPATPGLLGLPRDYVVSQLGAWRTGSRRALTPDCMAHVAQALTPADIHAVSTWLSTQSAPSDARPAAAPVAALPLSCGGAGESQAGDTLPRADAAMAARVPVGAAAKPSTATATATATAAAAITAASTNPVTRGAYLARLGNCAGCHTAPGGAPYAGGLGLGTPFGTLYAGNLTPDLKTGIGTWTAEDFWRALHEGRAKDGRALYPAFPYTSTTLTTREDADDLFAYLRSLTAVSRVNTAHSLRFPYNTPAALWLWRSLFFREGRYQADSKQSAEWNRGAYLVQGLGHCAECHAPRNAWGAMQGAAPLAGGLMPVQRWWAPSLVDAAQGGVNGRIEDTVALLQTGISPHASAMGPMAEVVQNSTQYWTAADLRAATLYLNSLARNVATAGTAAADRATAPRALQPPQAPQAAGATAPPRGAQIYEQHCAGCHGPQGQGAPGAYRPLAGNRAVTLAHPTNLIRIVLEGGFAPATAGNPQPYGMPPFGPTLSDADVAAVLSHIRGAWGNAAPVVSELQVLQGR